MKKILIVDNSTYVTGANKSIAAFTRALTPEYKFYWAVAESISATDLKDVIGDQQYRRYNFLEISKSPRSIVRYLPHLYANTRKLLNFIEQSQVSIIHMNDCYNMCGVAMKLLRKDIKVVYHVRLLRSSYISRIYGLLVRAIKGKADAIICCSEAVSRDVGPSPVPKKVIYDSDSFDGGADFVPCVRERVEKIVYVGNVLPGKGHALALAAFASVHREYPEVRFHFIGRFDHNEASTVFKKQLDSLTKELSLEGQVSFDGYKSDIEQQLATADILVNLSESESFSMVCLEGLKAGVPLVAADSGGPAELFEHMNSGYLVPNKNPEAAADAIKHLITDLGLRRRFATKGREYVHQKFNVIKNAAELDKLYRSLTSGL